MTQRVFSLELCMLHNPERSALKSPLSQRWKFDVSSTHSVPQLFSESTSGSAEDTIRFQHEATVFCISVRTYWKLVFNWLWLNVCIVHMADPLPVTLEQGGASEPLYFHFCYITQNPTLNLPMPSPHSRIKTQTSSLCPPGPRLPLLPRSSHDWINLTSAYLIYLKCALLVCLLIYFLTTLPYQGTHSEFWVIWICCHLLFWTLLTTPRHQQK